MLKKDPKERPESNVVLMEMRQKNCMLQFIDQRGNNFSIAIYIYIVFFLIKTKKDIIIQNINLIYIAFILILPSYIAFLNNLSYIF